MEYSAMLLQVRAWWRLGLVLFAVYQIGAAAAEMLGHSWKVLVKVTAVALWAVGIGAPSPHQDQRCLNGLRNDSQNTAWSHSLSRPQAVLLFRQLH
jgi:hypothetical protein